MVYLRILSHGSDGCTAPAGLPARIAKRLDVDSLLQPRPEIAAFWTWWSDARAEIEDSLGAGRDIDHARAVELSERVDAIDPSLAWELGSHGPGSYELTVTAEGNHDLYAEAARWAAACPTDSPAWSYWSLRQPARDPSGLVLRLHGHDVALEDARFSLDERSDVELVDIRVDHPVLRDISGDEAAGMALLLLDALVGEAAVERSIGVIEVGRVRWRGADSAALRELIRRIAEVREGEAAQGISHWVSLDSGRDGLPGILTVNASVRHIDYPLFDARAEIRLQLLAPTPFGLTTDAEAELLVRMQEKLLGAIGSDAVLTSRETHDGYRTLNIAFDGNGNVPAWLEKLRSSWTAKWPVEVRIEPDPGWIHARELLAMTRPA
jgi:Family of unknown function (DUF695)